MHLDGRVVSLFYFFINGATYVVLHMYVVR